MRAGTTRLLHRPPTGSPGRCDSGSALATANGAGRWRSVVPTSVRANRQEAPRGFSPGCESRKKPRGAPSRNRWLAALSFRTPFAGRMHELGPVRGHARVVTERLQGNATAETPIDPAVLASANRFAATGLQEGRSRRHGGCFLPVAGNLSVSSSGRVSSATLLCTTSDGAPRTDGESYKLRFDRTLPSTQ